MSKVTQKTDENKKASESPVLFVLSFWTICLVLAGAYQWYNGSYTTLLDLFNTGLIIMFGILVVSFVVVIYAILLFID